MEKLQTVRKSGLTFAPEAGTQRLRDVINKNLTEAGILDTCARAFSGGWNNVKLYFMLGLPTETDEDVLGIAELVYKVVKTWQVHASNKKRGLRVHVATAYFVPKPFTPFQWEKQIPPEEYLPPHPAAEGRHAPKAVVYNWHARTCPGWRLPWPGGPAFGARHRLGRRARRPFGRLGRVFPVSNLAGCLCRLRPGPGFLHGSGLRRGGAATLANPVCRRGSRFSSAERRRAYEGLVTPDCRQACAGCGANRLFEGGGLRCLDCSLPKRETPSGSPTWI